MTPIEKQQEEEVKTFAKRADLFFLDDTQQ
jgi:hypothetical protein